MSKSSETELCFYAKVTHREGFEQAASQELQQQYSYTLPVAEDGTKRGRVRVRSTTADGVVRYEETLKLPFESDAVFEGNTEYTVTITEEYYKAWVQTYGASCVNKIRYVFLSKDVKMKFGGEEVTLPTVKYEVDVFLDSKGLPSKWCKVDIEIDAILAYLEEHRSDIKTFNMSVALSSLPIGLESAFEATTKDTYEKAAIKRFWETFSQSPKKTESV